MLFFLLFFPSLPFQFSSLTRDANHARDRPLGTVKVIRLSAKESALNHGIPNFFFHLQTAYAILRSKGVPLGKLDYIGSFLGEKQ